MTECPVCSSKNIKPNDAICPDCQSDLSSLKLIEKIDSQLERGPRIKPLLILVLVFMVLSWAGMYWYVNKTFAKGRDSSLDESFQDLKYQNEQLKYQLGFLGDKLDKLKDPTKVNVSVTPTDTVAQEVKPKVVPQRRVSWDRTYVVQEGETVWDIASRFYGDGSYYRQIMSDNGIDSVNNVKPGMKLTLKKHE